MVEKNILNKKYNYLLIVGFATFIVSLIAFFVVIKPLYQKSSSLTKEVSVRQADLKYLKEKKAKLEELKDREEELKADAEKVESALPTNEEVGRLFIQQDNIAKSSGGSINSVNISEASATGNVSEGIQLLTFTLPVQFKNYSNFKDFLVKSENALRLIDINGFSITANDNGDMTTTLNSSTFVRK